MVTLQMLEEAEKNFKKMKKEYAYQEAKFKVGDEVLLKSKGKAYKITEITYPQNLGRLVFQLNNLLKSGKAGMKRIYILGENIEKIVIKTN